MEGRIPLQAKAFTVQCYSAGLTCDIAARMLFDPYETPIGVFTALIGIPFFISVARKERG